MDTQKQNAQRELGAKSESHTTAKSTVSDYTYNSPKGKRFDSDAFLRQISGDVALLYLSAARVASGHPNHNHTEILRAAVSIANILEVCKPRYAHGQIIGNGMGVMCGYTTGTYTPGNCRAATCLSFRLMDAENVLGDCKLAELRGQR